MAIRTWKSDEYRPYWEDRNHAYLDRMERRLIRNLVGSGKWFMDLGGGYGRLMDVYKHAYARIVICDYSMSMLEDANRHLTTSGIQNVSLVAADVGRLPFIDDVFEGAMMVRVIHHIENPRPVIREVHRILKPRAAFILEYQNTRNINFLIKARLGLMNREALESQAPFLAGPMYWKFHPLYMEGILSECFVLERMLGGGLFWNREFFTKVIPRLEVIDSLLAPFLGKHTLTHQLFLRLHSKKEDLTRVPEHMPRDESIVEMLRCPCCHEPDLQRGASELQCTNCRRSYGVHDNIYDFRLGDS
jgi:SAM-dependent methyltransferase